jgi:RNA polymerase sigma-70 factor, ECF subfamily
MQRCLGATCDAKNGQTEASADLELVAAARAGSNAAFEQIQRRYSRRLYVRILSITRNREDAEDALQETFLRAYMALGTFEGRSQFASWLTRIATNSALMLLRRRRVRAEVSYERPSEAGEPAVTIDVRDTALDPEQLYDLRQRSDSVLRAISKLNTTLRTPLTTRISQECSVKELAQTLGLSLATVKARLWRARKKLANATGMKARASNHGVISSSRRQHLIRSIQKREQSCMSFD